ncbi:MAG TPA: CPBP family intramembrane glutamic endopeptidase [Anaerolineales bacterium]|nr:CPBP family intramembrane glutamic endopeptidase [Anaerolineales bacterium]
MNNDTKEIQYSLSKIMVIWALASLPGALLFWLGLPFLDEHTQISTTYLVLIVLVIPYIWQLILSLLILKHENGKLHWDMIKDRLWLKTTTDPRTGKRNNALWLWLVPVIAVFALTSASPLFLSINNWWARILLISEPVQYSTDMLFEHPDTLVGNWGFVLAFLLVSVLTMSEEIIFRGILLPRMKGVFGRADWFANGILFALYHLDRPWAWPGFILYDSLTLALPARLFRSTWFSITVHFSQAIYFLFLIGGLVLGLA